MSEIRADKLHNVTGDNDSGIDLSTNDKVAIKIADAEVATVDTTGVVFNDGSADRDFRVESNGNANMLFVDGGNDAVVIGQSAPDTDISGGTPSFQVTGSGFNSVASLTRREANAFGASLAFVKSRNTTVGSNTIVQDGDVVGEISFFADDGTDLDSKVANIVGQVQGTPGANDTPGKLTFGTTADGASSPTERMRILSDGNIAIAKTTADNTNAGTSFFGVDGMSIVRSAGTVQVINRLTNDGVLVSFRQASGDEGNISVSGSTISYNGGHLSRWSQLTNNVRDETIVKGTVMTNLDQMAEWTTDGVTEDNEQLNCMAVSSVEGDANVAGVFVNWDNDDDVYTNDMNVAMTGDMVIRIAQGTTVARGDLLMSAGDGTAKPQGDDIVRSKTIAKVTSTNVSHTYDDGSYLVPCVLMAC